MLKAAEASLKEGICFPVLLGNEEKIARIAAENHINLEGIEIINLRHDREENRRIEFAQQLTAKRYRQGMTFEDAYEKMYERNYFGMMMVEMGQADALITGVYSKYADTIQVAKDVIGFREGLNHIGAMHILNTKKGIYFFADTLINRNPTHETLKDIVKLTHSSVQLFGYDPVMAMVSYTNFGAEPTGSPAAINKVVQEIHNEHPEIVIDGEMQVNFALNTELRDKKYPFSKLTGKKVNTLIFPSLSSSNSAYKLLLEMGMADSIGPIQMGLKKPIHILDIESSVRDIVNVTAVAVIDALMEEKKKQ
jgi:malate dehydrogenase (oxaloacetate-decarboxylating)(NADP+)